MVWCRRCGEQFDEVKCNGICPRCGSFQRQTGRAKMGEREIVIPVFAAIIVLSVLCTAILVPWKRYRVMKEFTSLNFERVSADIGEPFEMYGRQMLVEKAEAIDLSEAKSGPGLIGEKLVGVTVRILPADPDFEDDSTEWESRRVYVSDGLSCKKYLYSDTVGGILYFKEKGADLDEERYDYGEELAFIEEWKSKEYIFEKENYLYDCPEEGQKGVFYFLVDENAAEVSINFEEKGSSGKTSDIPILEKRVSILLPLEEEK